MQYLQSTLPFFINHKLSQLTRSVPSLFFLMASSSSFLVKWYSQCKRELKASNVLTSVNPQGTHLQIPQLHHFGAHFQSSVPSTLSSCFPLHHKDTFLYQQPNFTTTIWERTNPHNRPWPTLHLGINGSIMSLPTRVQIGNETSSQISSGFQPFKWLRIDPYFLQQCVFDLLHPIPFI